MDNKKNNNKNREKINVPNFNEIEKNIPLIEERINLPILKPIKETNNKNQIVDEDILQSLLEDSEKETTKKKEKKDKKDSDENISLEILFDTQLKKRFHELNPNNSRIKIIKDIIESIKTRDIKNYNPRISGPYLVGSYRSITNLSSLNYTSPVDIMYTYKDILIDEKIMNYTVTNIIEDILNLNKLEVYEIIDDENKISKIRIKCTNPINTNIIIYIKIYFVDIGYDYNETIINNIIFKGEKMVYKNKEEEKNFINLMLYLRIWRKKHKLYFLIPEILDEFAKKYFDQKNTIALSVVNVFYDLYNSINDFNHKKNEGFLPKNKLLIENLIGQWFDNEKKSKAIKMAVLQTNNELYNRNINELFEFSEDD